MHNPTVFRAKFSRLIITVFGKEQILNWMPEIEMYQLRDSPEVWATRMAATGGPLKWQDSSPAKLARIIEESFMERLTEWIPISALDALLPRQKPKNVIWIDSRRRA